MLGEVKNNSGVIFDGENYKVVKIVMPEGKDIPKHNHESNTIIFSVLIGKMELILSDGTNEENHILIPGDVLRFDGSNYISGSALEDSEINVTIVKK